MKSLFTLFMAWISQSAYAQHARFVDDDYGEIASSTSFPIIGTIIFCSLIAVWILGSDRDARIRIFIFLLASCCSLVLIRFGGRFLFELGGEYYGKWGAFLGMLLGIALFFLPFFLIFVFSNLADLKRKRRKRLILKALEEKRTK